MTAKIHLTSGKRKTAIARAQIRAGKGRIRIDGVPLEIYEPWVAREKIREAVILAGDVVNGWDVEVDIRGGGYMSRASAARTALAKAIVAATGSDEIREAYLGYDRSLLVSDTRRKMPKKPLGRGARKKRQKSYR